MSRRRQKRNQEALWGDLPGLFDLGADEESTPLRPLNDDILSKPEQVRFISFGSGSSGNCSYIGTPSCGLLIDAGVDNNKVMADLAANSINPSSIAGILLTHDHGDHVRFAYAILRRNQHMRLYATPKAMAGLLRRHSMSRRIKDYHTPIYKEFSFTVGPFTVIPFETSHDGTDNVGFSIQGAGTSMVICTDTGTITARADYYIRRTTNLMIEANYDAEMLRKGRYPVYLKARIVSASGHLDNADTGRYLASVSKTTEIHRIFLCHLSQDNNTPQIALSTVRTALEEAGVEVAPVSAGTDPGAGRVYLSVLPRTDASPMVVLS